MTFENWLKCDLDECYYQRDLLRWYRTSPKHTEPSGMHLIERPWLLKRMISHLTEGGKSRLAGMHTLSKALAYGPKVIRLSNVDFDILEQTDVTLSVADYKQPFETVVIELPEEYSKKHEIKDILEGRINEFGKMHGATTRPAFAIIVQNEEINTVFLSIYMENTDCFTVILDWEDSTIEDQLRAKISIDSWIDSLPVSQEEKVMYLEVSRAALNTCLFLNDFGMKKDGPTNQSYYDRLQRYLTNARKSNDQKKIQSVIRNLSNVPVYYSFKQEVKLHAQESKTVTDATGRIMAPHRRRGHYRMQRFGKGLCEQKRVWIKPVKINWHLFVGDEKDTSTTIRD